MKVQKHCQWQMARRVYRQPTNQSASHPATATISSDGDSSGNGGNGDNDSSNNKINRVQFAVKICVAVSSSQEEKKSNKKRTCLSFASSFPFFSFARSMFLISCIVINRAHLISSHSLSTLFAAVSLFLTISLCRFNFFPAFYIDDFPPFMIHFMFLFVIRLFHFIHWLHSCVHFDMIYMFSQILK